MEITGGVFHALAVLLAAAGFAKLIHPAGVTAALDRLHPPGWSAVGRLPVGRMLGAVEIAVAVGAVAAGGRLFAALLTAAYLIFTLVAWRLAAGPDTSCGCFGATDSPVGRVHVAVDLAFTVAAAATILRPPGPIADLAGPPGLVVVHVLGVAVLAGLGYLLFSALPALLAARRTVEAG